MDYCGIIPKDLAIGALWPQIGALIASAIVYGRGEYTLEDIRDGIECGQMFVVGCVSEAGEVEFVVTCVIAAFPRKQVLYIQYGAGRGGVRRSAATSGVATSWRARRARRARRVRSGNVGSGRAVLCLCVASRHSFAVVRSARQGQLCSAWARNG